MFKLIKKNELTVQTGVGEGNRKHMHRPCFKREYSSFNKLKTMSSSWISKMGEEAEEVGRSHIK